MVNMILRSLLLISIWSTTQADNYVLISGLAYHVDKQNIVGEDYEYFIPGAGIQHRRECELLECSASAMIVRDSNGEAMYSGTLGIGYLLGRVNLGLEFGLASRVVYLVTYSASNTTITKDRHIIGLAMPKAEIHFDGWMLNVGWIPPVETSSISITQTWYVNFGIKI